MSILARRIEKVLTFTWSRWIRDSLRRNQQFLLKPKTVWEGHYVLCGINSKIRCQLCVWDQRQRRHLIWLDGPSCQKCWMIFGLHKRVIEAFKAIYDNPTARIKINGSLSKSFTLERSCKRGCPCSPLLFALFIEPLSQYIRQITKIRGINIAGAEHKLSLFVLLLFLSQPLVSLPLLKIW